MHTKQPMMILFTIIIFSFICASAVAVSKDDLISYYRSQSGIPSQKDMNNSGLLPDVVVTPTIHVPITVTPFPPKSFPDFPPAKINLSSLIPSKPTVFPTPTVIPPGSKVEKEKITYERAVSIALSSMKDGYSGTGCDVQFTVSGVRMGAGAPAYATKNPYWIITLDGRYTNPAACICCFGLMDQDGTVVDYGCTPVGGIVVIDSVTGEVLMIAHAL
jgi:hypothetical protein